MSLDAIVHGELATTPEERTDVNGKAYTVTHVLTDTREARELIHVITHVPTVGLTLQTMDKGDSVAMSGPLTIRREDGRATVGLIARRMLQFQPTRDYK